MLNSTLEQFRLAEDGQVSWQKNATNPLPGVVIAQLKKGAHILKPDFALMDVEILKPLDSVAVKAKLQEWLDSHIQGVLEDLILLQDTQNLCESGASIAAQLYDAMGILPREQVEGLIAGLDSDARRPLRRKKIKLGPILIFIYSLNKPVAIRLRALLWSLYHEKPLPALVPNDGVVSIKVEPKSVDAAYYCAIGYPIYANRAIRVDMLDRLIGAVYDSADKGQFKARHEMAEWLGCSIEDLYLVLEAMGHKKIFDPADHGQVEKKPDVSKEVVALDGGVSKEDGQSEAEVGTEADPKVEAGFKADIKPELAVFRLKKGRANQKGSSSVAVSRSKTKSLKKEKKAMHKTSKPKRDEGPRIIKSYAPKAKPEDSPFAILEQLKK